MTVKYFITLIVVVLGFANSQICHASETDNFSMREQVPDSTEWLDQQMNQAIQASLSQATIWNPYSVQQVLFKQLGGLFWADIELWADKQGSPAVKLPFEKSIFRDVGDIKGTGHFIRKLISFKAYYSPGLFRVGETVFGADKLGHFLQLGYIMYYAKMRKERPNFQDIRPFYIRLADYLTGDKQFRDRSPLSGKELVYAYSRWQEDGEWGMTGPMARSFGDIAANVEGYHFWSQLTDGPNPYIKMNPHTSQWEQARTFHWADYANPAWDEAVNRTVYHPKIAAQVETRIQEVLQASCADLPSCTKIIERYGIDTPHILNPNQCAAAALVPKD